MHLTRAGREWNTQRAHSTLTRARVATRAGVVIDPIRRTKAVASQDKDGDRKRKAEAATGAAKRRK